MPSAPSQSLQPTPAHHRQDELFALLLHKIPTSTDRHQLEEATMAALQLILRRTGDKDLIDDLKCQIDMAVFGVGEEGSGPDGEHQLDKAASRCAEILQRGREKRKQRDTLHASPPHPAEPQTKHHPHHHDMNRNPPRGKRRAAGLALIAALAAISTWFYLEVHNPSHTAAELVRQMDDAARGNGPLVHVFGGPLTVTKDNNAISVVAGRIPADICVSASWLLIRKGIVAIDGATPQRVTPSQLSDLCHEQDAGATLTWSQRIDDQNNAPRPDDPPQNTKGE